MKEETKAGIQNPGHRTWLHDMEHEDAAMAYLKEKAATTQVERNARVRRLKKARGDSRNDVWLSASLTAILDAYRARTGVSRAEGIREILASKLEGAK